MSKKKSGGYAPAASLESVEQNHKETYVAFAVIFGVLAVWVSLCASAYQSTHRGAVFVSSIGPAMQQVAKQGPMYFWPVDYSIVPAALVAMFALALVLLEFTRTKFRLKTNRDQGHSAKWADVGDLTSRYAEME